MNEPLLVIGIAILFLGVFPGLFLNFSITLWCSVIGGGLIFAHSKTPQAKAQLAQDEVEKQASIERGNELNRRFQQFSNNPSDTESLEYVLNVLSSQDKKSLKNWMRPIIIPLLKVRPLDSAIRDTVFSYAKIAITIKAVGQNDLSSKEIYDAALEVLSQHPDQISLKQYALEVGRWHHSIQRLDRKVTIYDEQAINNDIAVRSK